MNQLSSHSSLQHGCGIRSTLPSVLFCLADPDARCLEWRRGGTLLLSIAVCIVTSMCCTAAKAQIAYRDPGGAFTVQVPTGWKTQTQEGQGISIVNEEARASVTVGVMQGSEASTPTPQSELDDVQSQIGKTCRNARIKQRGSSTLGGLNGLFLTLSCTESDGEELLKFVAASRPGLVVLLNSSVPAANAARLQSVMRSIENSVALGSGSTDQSKAVADLFKQDSEAPDLPRQLAALVKACDLGTLSKDECAQKMASLKVQPGPGASAGPGTETMTSNDPNFDPNINQGGNRSSGQGGSPATSSEDYRGPNGGSRAPSSGDYRDSQGRFSLAIPDGWTATPSRDSSGDLQLANGESWATVRWMEGTGDGSSTPVDITNAILLDLKRQYKKGKLVDEGDFLHGGHSAHGASASAIDLHGVKVSVMVIGIQAQGLNFITIVASAPQEQSKDLTDEMQRLVKSIRFGAD